MKLAIEEHEEELFCMTISLHFLPDRGKRIEAFVDDEFLVTRVWTAYGHPNRKVMHLRFSSQGTRESFKKRVESLYTVPGIQVLEAS